uniref:Phosphotransferase n=1 Tax=Solanum tuberosum TaxID=4113 RepID=M1ALJ6_SOLTU
MSVTVSSPAVRSFHVSRSPHKTIYRPRVIMSAVRSSDSLGVAPILTKLQKDCATPLPVLRHVADAMADDMRAGLAVDGGSDLKMILSYVDTLPTGNEKGLFYALDLGGTNFRVLRVQLGGKEERVVATEFEQVSIPPELMFATSEELFDFIASALGKFAQKEGGNFELQQGRTREIGFTFSFPVKQTSIRTGILIKWTKGFAVSGTAGKDVVACLNEAMERRGMDMQVSALVNDTVGTLAGARYWDDDAMVAVILGTGTNACYVERVDAIPKLTKRMSKSPITIVNTEWGAFSNGLPLTEFDREMDAESINPGEQASIIDSKCENFFSSYTWYHTVSSWSFLLSYFLMKIFEKTISGMYLGEIVRRVLVKMSKVGGLFGGSYVPEKLVTPFVLRTPDICAMQQDTSRDLEAVESVLYDVAGVKSDLSARKTVVDICDTIAKRGGRLAGAGIVGILQKMEEDSKGLIFGKRAVVAMDGGLYEHYPQYRGYLQEAVTELLGSEISKNVVIEHSKDGSGIGAALLAAANSKYEHDY